MVLIYANYFLTTIMTQKSDLVTFLPNGGELAIKSAMYVFISLWFMVIYSSKCSLYSLSKRKGRNNMFR